MSDLDNLNELFGTAAEDDGGSDFDAIFGDNAADEPLPMPEEVTAAMKTDPSTWTNGPANIVVQFPPEINVWLEEGAIFSWDHGKHWTEDPYMTVPEKVVYSNAERGTLTQLYANIEKDLLKGLEHVSDNYDQPKYHFNKQAAYAFATRFYLYKRDYDKVIQYATMALGTNPMGCMRTEYWSKSYSTQEQLLFAYSNTQSPNNFLLTATYSTFYRSLNGRYACNRQASRASIYGQGPTWQGYTFHPCYQKVQGLYLRGSQDYGLFYVHTGEYFEYTDKVAGIGYVHNVNPTFTGEETLLCRAEAYIMKGDYAHALADLKVWDESRKVGTTENLPALTESAIESFYRSNPVDHGTVVNRATQLHCSDMCPSWTIDSKQILWLNCVLHFRRLELHNDRSS